MRMQELIKKNWDTILTYSVKFEPILFLLKQENNNLMSAIFDNLLKKSLAFDFLPALKA